MAKAFHCGLQSATGASNVDLIIGLETTKFAGHGICLRRLLTRVALVIAGQKRSITDMTGTFSELLNPRWTKNRNRARGRICGVLFGIGSAFEVVATVIGWQTQRRQFSRCACGFTLAPFDYAQGRLAAAWKGVCGWRLWHPFGCAQDRLRNRAFPGLWSVSMDVGLGKYGFLRNDKELATDNADSLWE